jgi:site-specific DNA-methyltransferase (adenine-specific)
MPDASVDAVVTDPPYGLSFMGKKWDYDVPGTDVWAECLRVLKPGGHLLAFAGTRTQHRMCVRIEDAGFEIRDMIAWVYAQGFPKSHNLDGERKGWGTSLKPALEPVTVARKPLTGTVAENVQEWGTGAINVDGCRVGTETRWNPSAGNKNLDNRHTVTPISKHGETLGRDCFGRWPANLIHDGSDEVVAGFPGDDSGSASRFFYCAKASTADREDGVAGVAGVAGCYGNFADKTRPKHKNHHPTVKPTALMQYLCRLVTPPGGTVLDPFTGSGSTGKAAILEGFNFIGIEREAEYVEIARARIADAERRHSENLVSA